MSSTLARTSCLNHPNRPASARCPGCGTFYCGECITEHDGRLTCARCLASERGAQALAKRKERRFLVMPLLQALIGLVLAWLFWYAFAQVLLMIPAEFHDGAVWK